MFAERGLEPLEAGHQEGEVAVLPVQHPLELRYAAADLGGPRAQERGAGRHCSKTPAMSFA